MSISKEKKKSLFYYFLRHKFNYALQFTYINYIHIKFEYIFPVLIVNRIYFYYLPKNESYILIYKAKQYQDFIKIILFILDVFLGIFS